MTLAIKVANTTNQPLAPRIMGIALRVARQFQDNGLVNFWLKIVQETLI